MGFEAKKTELAGPKKGNGAYWGPKQDAKNESNKIRRRNAKTEIVRGIEAIGEAIDVPETQTNAERLAKSDLDIREGRVYGPFDTADEMAASIETNLKKLRIGKRKAAPER